MSTERNGIDPYNGDIIPGGGGGSTIIEKGYGIITPGQGGGGSGSPVYTPIFYNPWL